MTEDEIVGWHHDGDEFEQAPGFVDGQVGLACCSPWGRKELDMPKQLNNKMSCKGEMLTFWSLSAGPLGCGPSCV